MKWNHLIGVNLEPGSPAMKVWWGAILTCLPPLTIIGLPMLVVGLVQASGGRLDPIEARTRRRADALVALLILAVALLAILAAFVAASNRSVSVESPPAEDSYGALIATALLLLLAAAGLFWGLRRWDSKRIDRQSEIAVIRRERQVERAAVRQALGVSTNRPVEAVAEKRQGDPSCEHCGYRYRRHSPDCPNKSELPK